MEVSFLYPSPFSLIIKSQKSTQVLLPLVRAPNNKAQPHCNRILSPLFEALHWALNFLQYHTINCVFIRQFVNI